MQVVGHEAKGVHAVAVAGNSFGKQLVQTAAW